MLCCFIPFKKFRHKLRYKLSVKNFLIDRGKHNKVILLQGGQIEHLVKSGEICGLNIVIYGDGNTIKLATTTGFQNSTIEIEANNSQIEIGKETHLTNVLIWMHHGSQQSLKIGNHTTMGSATIFLSNDASCIIGDDCMLSWNLDIRASDAHVIFDNDTGKISNRQKNPLTIGNHCWIGLAARITKNAIIPNNTIVATAAVVSKQFTEENTIIAGNPAKVVKRGVSWDRKDICKFQTDD